MTGGAWDGCDDPRKLLEWGRRLGSERRFRLFACAFWRWATTKDGVTPAPAARALKFAESCADTGIRPDGYPAWFPGWHPLLARIGFDAASWSVRGSPACGRAWVGDTEQAQQVALVREVFGNPFRPISMNPTWLTPTVANLATIAYEERALPSGELDTPRVAILADALEEAGCDNQEILGHLRSSGPHTRGCWSLDLVLGLS